MLLEALGWPIHHQPWCAGHENDDGAIHVCMRTVEITGVRVILTRDPLAFAMVCQDRAPLTAAQARHLAADCAPIVLPDRKR